MIGLFLGNTDFPKLVLKSIKKKKIKYLIIDLSKKKVFKNDKFSYYFHIGQIGKIINFLKKKIVKKLFLPAA